jgi:hypothetical protein
VTGRLSLLLGIAGVLLLVGTGCGGDKAPPASPANLIVEQTIDPHGGIPIEGEYSYVRIETPGGERVAEQRLHPVVRPRWHARGVIRLDPGSYKLISYQRTCDGNCGVLDSPMVFCSGSFRMSGDLEAMVHVNFGSGCSIKFVSAEAVD